MLKKTATEKISLFQLFVLIFLFEIGSTVVVGVAIEAKQDAWIAILNATIIGLIIVRMYTFFLVHNPGKNLFEIIKVSFGKWISIVLTLFYIIYFIYLASRVLRDFLELLVTDTFPNTPIEVLSVTFMLVMSYIIYLGLEVFARTSEIFFPYFAIFLILISLFLYIGDDIKMENLKPIMADGFKPIMQTVFPKLIGFPFGELIVFTVFMSYTKNIHKIHMISLLGVLISGAILAYHSFLIISVLGVDYTTRSSFPLLNVVREISVANFIERLDAAVVFIMMLGIFIKVGLFFYGGLKGLEFIFKLPYRYFAYPIGMLVALFSILIASNYTEHIEEGLDFVPLYLHLPFQIGIPVILSAIVAWKNTKKG